MFSKRTIVRNGPERCSVSEICAVRSGERVHYGESPPAFTSPTTFLNTRAYPACAKWGQEGWVSSVAYAPLILLRDMSNVLLKDFICVLQSEMQLYVATVLAQSCLNSLLRLEFKWNKNCIHSLVILTNYNSSFNNKIR